MGKSTSRPGVSDPGARTSNATGPQIGKTGIVPGRQIRGRSPFNMQNYQMMNSHAPSTGFQGVQRPGRM